MLAHPVLLGATLSLLELAKLYNEGGSPPRAWPRLTQRLTRGSSRHTQNYARKQPFACLLLETMILRSSSTEPIKGQVA
jgi:hypothetical protein